MPTFYLLVVGSLLSCAFAQKQTCYYPDGLTVDRDGIPCDTSENATASVCCRKSEACMGGGVCYTQWDSVVYRRSCTDFTYKDPACPRPCLNLSRNRPMSLLQCSSSTEPTYCCAQTDASCCTDKKDVFNFIPGDFLGIINDRGELGTIPSASDTTQNPALRTQAANAKSSSASTPDETSNPGASDTSASRASLVVGLAVGIPLGTLLIAAAAVAAFFFKRQKRREQQQRQQSQQNLLLAEPPYSYPKAELESKRYVAELPSSAYARP